MRISGENTLAAPVAAVWDAILDPAVLVRTIPGCERLETTGENSYAMTVSAGVAAIRGTYDGTCELSELVPHESLTMKLNGAGAPGTIGADVKVRFAPGPNDSTVLSYDAYAIVGGMIGGVGQRMLTSVSRRMAAEFFGNVEKAIAGELPATTAPVSTTDGSSPTVHVAPTRATSAGSPDDLLKGIAIGAGLVLLGVLVGRLSKR